MSVSSTAYGPVSRIDCEHSSASWMSLEVDDVQRRALGPIDQAHLRLEDRDERAFGARDQPRHAERPRLRVAAARERMRPHRHAEQLVQVVAGDAAPLRRIAGADVVSVCVADARHLAIDRAFERLKACLRLELRGRDLAEDDLAAVGQQRGDLDDVVDGEAVRDRVRAPGVVAEHAADGRAVRRRRVGAEQEAHRPHVVVQLVLHHAGLHARPVLLLIDLEDVVHVAREVEDEGVVDRLPGQRRPPAARQERDAVLARQLERRLHVVRVARDDDAHGLHLVHGRIGRIEELRAGVEAYVTANDLLQLAFEIVHAVII